MSFEEPNKTEKENPVMNSQARALIDYSVQLEKTCNRIVNIGKIVFVGFPIFLMTVQKLANMDKTSVLLIWIIGMFILALALILVGYFDYTLREKIKDVYGDDVTQTAKLKVLNGKALLKTVKEEHSKDKSERSLENFTDTFTSNALDDEDTFFDKFLDNISDFDESELKEETPKKDNSEKKSWFGRSKSADDGKDTSENAEYNADIYDDILKGFIATSYDADNQAEQKDTKNDDDLFSGNTHNPVVSDISKDDKTEEHYESVADESDNDSISDIIDKYLPNEPADALGKTYTDEPSYTYFETEHREDASEKPVSGKTGYTAPSTPKHENGSIEDILKGFVAAGFAADVLSKRHKDEKTEDLPQENEEKTYVSEVAADNRSDDKNEDINDVSSKESIHNVMDEHTSKEDISEISVPDNKDHADNEIDNSGLDGIAEGFAAAGYAAGNLAQSEDNEKSEDLSAAKTEEPYVSEVSEEKYEAVKGESGKNSISDILDEYKNASTGPESNVSDNHADISAAEDHKEDAAEIPYVENIEETDAYITEKAHIDEYLSGKANAEGIRHVSSVKEDTIASYAEDNQAEPEEDNAPAELINKTVSDNGKAEAEDEELNSALSSMFLSKGADTMPENLDDTNVKKSEVSGNYGIDDIVPDGTIGKFEKMSYVPEDSDEKAEFGDYSVENTSDNTGADGKELNSALSSMFLSKAADTMPENLDDTNVKKSEISGNYGIDDIVPDGTMGKFEKMSYVPEDPDEKAKFGDYSVENTSDNTEADGKELNSALSSMFLSGSADTMSDDLSKTNAKMSDISDLSGIFTDGNSDKKNKQNNTRSDESGMDDLFKE